MSCVGRQSQPTPTVVPQEPDFERKCLGVGEQVFDVICVSLSISSCSNHPPSPENGRRWIAIAILIGERETIRLPIRATRSGRR